MASALKKVIVTAAITGGIHTPSLSPYLPWRYEDLIEQGVAAFQAGAAILHVHGRNQTDGRPSAELKDFRVVCQEIKKRCPEAIIMPTTSGSHDSTTEERMAALSVLKPEIATFTPGSLNFCSADMALKEREWKFQWEKPYILASEDCVYTNSFKTIREYGMAFDEAGICPELEIFDVGMLSNVKYAISKGYLKARRLRIQYVLGTLGGMPADPESLFILRSETKRLLGDDISWSVSAGGKNQMGIMAVSMAMGGNVRVGLEDALYLERGRLAKNNAELVEKVVGIAKELGREIATPAEAREMIGLKGADQVAF